MVADRFAIGFGPQPAKGKAELPCVQENCKVLLGPESGGPDSSSIRAACSGKRFPQNLLWLCHPDSEAIGATRAQSGPPGHSRGHPGTVGATRAHRGHPGTVGAIRVQSGPSGAVGAIRVQSGPSGYGRGHPGTVGATRAPSGPPEAQSGPPRQWGQPAHRGRPGRRSGATRAPPW